MNLGPLHIAPKHLWFTRQGLVSMRMSGAFYLFKNLPHVKPGRWGFGFFGLVEFGSRNPGNKFGVWLKRHSLWPW